MTDDLWARLAELIAKWRESAAWEAENSNAQYGQGLDQCADDLDAVAALPAAPSYRFIDIVVQGAPGAPEPESGKFIEVENLEGRSIRIGEWIDRGDGYFALRIPVAALPAAGGPTENRPLDRTE